MTPTQTCHEIFRELLSPHLSTPTLEGILSQLGDAGLLPLSQIDSATAGSLRRRLERIGRSYLDTQNGLSTLQSFDALLVVAGIALPEYDPNVSGVFSSPFLSIPNTSGRFGEQTRSPLPISERIEPLTPSRSSQTGKQRTEIPSLQPPLLFPFKTEDDLDRVLARVYTILLDYLGDENVARRLEAGLKRAAQGNLRTHGGEIRLELDSGLRGRLVFKVTGKDGQVRLSGAALASTPSR